MNSGGMGNGILKPGNQTGTGGSLTNVVAHVLQKPTFSAGFLKSEDLIMAIRFDVCRKSLWW